MARINNLTNFLTDIATAIKSKTGRNTNITPSNFDTEILSIASDLTTKTITTNGTYNASSDNVDGYSSVTVNVPTATITDARYLCAYGRVNLYDTLLAMCSGITSASYMFYNSGNVANLDLSKLNRFNITDMSFMFDYAGFRSLDFSNLNTSNVTNMGNMFGNVLFSSLDLSSFDTSNVTDMISMFDWAYYLTDLDISSFDTSNVTNMSYMFNYCSKLAALDISNFDFSGVTSYNKIFYNCGSSNSTPTTVYVKDVTAQQWILNLSSSDRPSNWSTSNVIIKGS